MPLVIPVRRVLLALLDSLELRVQPVSLDNKVLPESKAIPEPRDLLELRDSKVPPDIPERKVQRVRQVSPELRVLQVTRVLRVQLVPQV